MACDRFHDDGTADLFVQDYWQWRAVSF